MTELYNYFNLLYKEDVKYELIPYKNKKEINEFLKTLKFNKITNETSPHLIHYYGLVFYHNNFKNLAYCQ